MTRSHRGPYIDFVTLRDPLIRTGVPHVHRVRLRQLYRPATAGGGESGSPVHGESRRLRHRHHRLRRLRRRASGRPRRARRSPQTHSGSRSGVLPLPHVRYNFCRFPNANVAKHFASDTFWQAGNSGSENFIGEAPQLGFGGRSIFWSGLIPAIQGWELDYFPPRVRQDLIDGLLNRAGETMNES